MYFYIFFKRGKVNLTDIYNANVNYDIPNTHKNNLHMVLYKMDWLTLRLVTQHLARRHSQNVSSDSRKWLIKHLFPPSSCKKQINKQNSYLLLALLQSGSVPELDMHVSKHFLPGQFIHSVVYHSNYLRSNQI